MLCKGRDQLLLVMFLYFARGGRRDRHQMQAPKIGCARDAQYTVQQREVVFTCRRFMCLADEHERELKDREQRMTV